KPYVHAATHFASLPYPEIGAFMAQLQTRLHKNTGKRSLTSYLLEFIILTAVRHHQARELRWDDIKGDVWTCREHKSAKKMKQPHIVVLSSAALAILDVMRNRQGADGVNRDYVFVHGPRRAPLYPSEPTSFSLSGKRVSADGLLNFLTRTLARPDL